jgi:hypothetical protein
MRKAEVACLAPKRAGGACEVAFAAAAGPKCREALAAGARHQKLDAVFFTFLSQKKSRLFSEIAYRNDLPRSETALKNTYLMTKFGFFFKLWRPSMKRTVPDFALMTTE